MDSGIYQIRNTTNGDRYIGSSIHVKKRISEHRWMLLKGKHHSIFLQRAWNKYGDDCFKFEKICDVEKDNLKELESLILSEIDTAWFSPYNISRDATAPMRGLKHTKEWIEKSIKWKTGNKSKTGIASPWKQKKLSAEHIEKLVAAKENVSQETRLKMSLSRLGKEPWNKGKKYKLTISEETRLKLVAAANKRWHKIKES